MTTNFQPGSLVKLRNRDWIVMPSNDPDLLLVKPLGGSEDEVTGIYLPLNFSDELPETTTFPLPGENDISNFSTASLLYDASRLSFRNVSGPFRSFGKLSFRPRAYQIVPLIMALGLDPIRMLVADDVGVGKTIEALMIVRELLDRGEIKRFAVVCLPHLCEQWQQEIKDKFSIDAVIVRSSTAAQLDRKIQGDDSIFKSFPFQVVSIDFIKSDKRRSIFLSDCPELVIVDEAHTCTKPKGGSVSQQQRHHLIHDISREKDNQHLILLTATPHSGKQGEFQSLLGLIIKDYEFVDIVNSSPEKRKELAKHIVIRRRADVRQWHEDTPFPEREQKEVEYNLSDDYKKIFHDLLLFARESEIKDAESNSKVKFKYFAILSLLRGVMSSPSTGIEMLSKKATQFDETIDEDQETIITNPVADTDAVDSDAAPINLFDKLELKSSEAKLLKDIAERLDRVKDNKAAEALKVVKKWIADEFNPIIFCRFISTAKYLGEYLKNNLPQNTGLLVVTGEMVDEERRAKINELGSSSFKHRILVATDCMSEGINLQEHFTAVLHYDLPWNPNRLEQREGRIDRFGQTAPEVKAYMLWGKDNTMDSVVLNVLLRKAKEIRRQTGISVPFPEDSQSILDSLLNAVILNPNAVKIEDQLSLDLETKEIAEKEVQVTSAYEKAAERDKITRSVFAQHSIKVNEIEQDLQEVDENIGNPETVRNFVTSTVIHFGAQIKEYKQGYLLYTTNLLASLKQIFNFQDEIKISFISPTPQGYLYIGRNHPFVEQLSRILLNDSVFHPGSKTSAARASVIPTEQVKEKTTLIQLRVRNIIADKRTSSKLIAEEMIVWGYKGSIEDKKFLDENSSIQLLEDTLPDKDFSKQRQILEFNFEKEKLETNQDILKELVYERSEKFIEAHERFRKLVGGDRYKVVEPVLPPDILGIYILLPKL